MKTTNPLISHWFVTSLVMLLLCLSVIMVHFYGAQFRQPIEESQRLFWRTFFYIVVILIFPVTNLIRYIFLRLSQTMPILNQENIEQIAKKRYLLAVFVSQFVMILIGVLAMVIFYLGDVLNTFHILSGLAILGSFLYRPKNQEYQQIIDALTKAQENENE